MNSLIDLRVYNGYMMSPATAHEFNVFDRMLTPGDKGIPQFENFDGNPSLIHSGLTCEVQA